MQYQVVKGNLLREMERYQEALSCYEQAKEQYQDSPGLHYNMGRCYEAQRLSDMAKESYKRVMALHDHYADTLERLGDLHWNQYKQTSRRQNIKKRWSTLPGRSRRGRPAMIWYTGG